MDEAEYTKIMGLFESHLQVKKLSVPGTIRLYLHSVQMLVAFCDKFHQELVLPEKWKIENVGVRELEAFLKYQIDVLHWKRSTLVTCISGIKVFYQYLAESQHMSNNPIQHFKLPRDISEIGQQRYEIDKINLLFQHDPQSTLKGYQQRLLLEFIYGLGLSLVKIVKISSVIPELDEGRVRLYFRNSKFRDYPFNPPAIKILKSYLKLIDNIEGHESFWINNKGKTMTVGQLQTLLNKYFEDHEIPS
ncbi:MAG: phage integrase N-terminal SAM-like domain-containing protein, partial [Gammaproteobacteria bacterium]|nr:phage integrase N-terminal SAM-like domain-containing protein [Gammaproteobacteria bacterium]